MFHTTAKKQIYDLYKYKRERTMNVTSSQWFSLEWNDSGLSLGIHIPNAPIYAGTVVGLIIYISLIVVKLKKERFWP